MHDWSLLNLFLTSSWMAAADLQMKFRGAVSHVRTLTKKPSNDDLLELYSLYKQSTVGNCYTPVPGVLICSWLCFNAVV